MIKYIRYLMKIIEYRKNIKGKAILIDTPSGINLGDHAIVLAESQELEKKGVSTYELTNMQINQRESMYAKITPKMQCILIHGGGFLGSLWPDEEYRFRRILQAFQKNKIIVFPQTITFDLITEEGRKFLKESQKIYSTHSNLTIFVREKKSYEFMKQYFPKVRCLMTPDVVTLLDMQIPEKNRSGILFCLRNDVEKAIDDTIQQRIVEMVHERYPNEKIEFTDTVVDYNIRPEERNEEVCRKLVQFSGSKLIVTDRLHGMVFAAITNTPCIAMSNSNGKVKAVYEWIKENEYVRFANSAEEVEQQLQVLNVDKSYQYNRSIVEREFEPLFDEIRSLQSL